MSAMAVNSRENLKTADFILLYKKNDPIYDVGFQARLSVWLMKQEYIKELSNSFQKLQGT